MPDMTVANKVETTGPLPATVPPKPRTRVRADHLSRANTAWAARVAGLPWAQVAQVAGYGSPEAAMKGVRTVYGRLPHLDREDLRNLWRDRLEVAWRQVTKDMLDQRPGAVTAAVRVAQAAAALDGLNEAVRLDVSVTETLDALTRELVSHDL